MRKKIYVSPSANRKNGYPNRYFVFLKENLAEYFDVLDADNEPVSYTHLWKERSV